ncbi:ATP-dependent nuclease [Stutzerimonas xanthomarina]|uniref:ATP-dependent nuclease n=1 Tax=Stutzerimonas xanthomarina TaxID=271420 RepID=UPI003AA84056
MITKIKIQGYRIYSDFTLLPNKDLNILVGGNDAGKSTLIEAIGLALNGRIGGRSAHEELNPYWFNKDVVSDFLKNCARGENPALPEIMIELFLENRPELQFLCGAINSDRKTNACPGISFKVTPNPEYEEELTQWRANPGELMPTEYYEVEWRSFGDEVLTRRPRQLAVATIDSRTVRSTSGIDYHLRQILSDHLEPSEKAKISQHYRSIKESMTSDSLGEVNNRLKDIRAPLDNQVMALAMDQSAQSSWEGSVTPHVDHVPFALAGQGQQASIKISLAMQRLSEQTSIVMIEEPENHLSHTSLTTLLSRIEEAAGERQLFISTHSAYVLNRLGLSSLLLLHRGKASHIAELDPDTVSYFQKLAGFDTLRMVLAQKLVLVEGPSDEILFERFFKDLYDKYPMQLGIDVMSMHGLTLKRCLELCSAIDRPVAVLRDNDGQEPESLKKPVKELLEAGKRELFIGSKEAGKTLEPQLMACNSEETLRKIFGVTDRANLDKWMSREKTEAALLIAKSKETLTAPPYMAEAAKFIHD